MRLDPEAIYVDSFPTTPETGPETGDQPMVTPIIPVTIGISIMLCDDLVNP